VFEVRGSTVFWINSVIFTLSVARGINLPWTARAFCTTKVECLNFPKYKTGSAVSVQLSWCQSLVMHFYLFVCVFSLPPIMLICLQRKEIVDDWNYDTSCMLTWLIVWGLENFKCQLLLCGVYKVVKTRGFHCSSDIVIFWAMTPRNVVGGYQCSKRNVKAIVWAKVMIYV
jgi:hypothetical protein